MESPNFNQELAQIRMRFNYTFGQQTVCNIGTRYRVILCIAFMGVLCDKINRAENTCLVKDEIDKFNRTKDKLTALFNQAETLWRRKETICQKN